MFKVYLEAWADGVFELAFQNANDVGRMEENRDLE